MGYRLSESDQFPGVGQEPVKEPPTGHHSTNRPAAPALAATLAVGWASFASGHGRPSLPQPIPEAAATAGDNAIASSAQAETAAVRFLGYSAREDLALSSKLEHGGDGANVPFLDAALRDQDIWHVVVARAPLLLSSNTPGRPRHEVTFDVYMEAQSGRLTRVVSRWPADRPEGLPLSPAASSAEKTHRGDDETWVVLGPREPNLTLMQSLDEVQQQGGEVHEAGRIEGYLVAMSRRQHSEPLPVWSIHLWGIPPAPASVPREVQPYEVPEAARDHMRYVVDDTTGKCLFLTTTPQPDIPPGWIWDKKTRSWNRPPEPEAKAGADGEHSATTPSENPIEPEDKR